MVPASLTCLVLLINNLAWIVFVPFVLSILFSWYEYQTLFGSYSECGQGFSLYFNLHRGNEVLGTNLCLCEMLQYIMHIRMLSQPHRFYEVVNHVCLCSCCLLLEDRKKTCDILPYHPVGKLVKYLHKFYELWLSCCRVRTHLWHWHHQPSWSISFSYNNTKVEYQHLHRPCDTKSLRRQGCDALCPISPWDWMTSGLFELSSQRAHQQQRLHVYSLIGFVIRFFNVSNNTSGLCHLLFQCQQQGWRDWGLKCAVLGEMMECFGSDNGAMKLWIEIGEVGSVGKNSLPNQSETGVKYSTEVCIGK